jgi:membrane fusion protein (multidrug efflux system)
MDKETKYDPVLDVPKEPEPPTAPPQAGPRPSHAQDAREYIRSRPQARWMILGVILILLVGGALLWRYLTTYESTDDAQIDGHVNPISARVGGYVIKVNVTDNQYVEQGAVLVEIDPKDYEVAVERAKADLADAEASAHASQINVPITSTNTASQLASSEADVENARAGITAAQQKFNAAQAQWKEAQANNARAQTDLLRYQQLVAKDEISRQQYDQALEQANADAAAVDAARANAAAAEQQVTQARGQLTQAQASLHSASTAPEQVASTRARASSAEAAVAQKQAALEQAKLNLLYATIVAPVSGVVNKNVEVGMNVQNGQQLLSIVPLDDVWVTANFKETQLTRMRPGQRATISVDAYGGKYKGRVDSIAGASGARFSLLPPENATGNYVKVVQRIPVKIVLEPGENKDHLLRVGMSVTPRVYVR